MRLKDKVAIVTGAGNGIGVEYSKRFAEEGAKVVVADILKEAAERTVNMIKELGYEAVSVTADIATEDGIKAMVDTCIDAFGRIDILVNNAGYYPQSDLLDLTYDQWKRVIAVNLDGPFLAAKAVAPYMIEQGGGKIINISTTCFFTGFETLIDYTAAKTGVVGLTRALARALGKYNINVNVIAPGLTASEALLKTQPENFAPAVEGQCLKRIQQAKDLAGTAVFLASSDSDMMTGQVIVVDGGNIFN